MDEPAINNREIADTLDRVADLFEAQDANPFRVRAYRAAATTIREHPTPLAEILAAGGLDAVDALPTIGPTIAAHVAELVRSRGLTLLERLEGEVSPERLLTSIPGLGPELAARIHDELHVDTLEELEAAAHDGRLGRVRGFGPRRVRLIRNELESILAHSARHRARRRAWLDRPEETRGHGDVVPVPSVAALLEIDAGYRRQAAAGELRRIAPRRFNPRGEAWLPILHAECEQWHVTALFSNTARAHELHKTAEWVVIFYERDGDRGQCTVVTEAYGPLKGRRVVRGREAECRAHYAGTSQAAPPARGHAGAGPALSG